MTAPSPLGVPIATGSPTTPQHPPANVLNRLHALFSSSSSCEAGPSRSRPSSIAVESEGPGEVTDEMSRISPTSKHVFKDREAIKIKICTWNMGDALPKGDLSVLLGTVPDYQTLEIRDGLPIVPLTDIHPYHLVIVAGQECPTESGVPRGLGGGLMKGMKLHGHKKGKDKDKDKEMAGSMRSNQSNRDETEEDESSDSTLEGRPNFSFTPEEITEASGSGESVDNSRASTPPISHTPTLHRHAHQQAAKGWSSMLDDWLCGPLPKPKEGDKSRSMDTPGLAPLYTSPLTVDSSFMQRSASAPLVVPDAHLQPGPFGLVPSRSPLARSPSSFSSSVSRSSSDSSLSDREAELATTPTQFTIPSATSATYSPSKPRRAERPEIIIPVDEPLRGMEGSKCYLHLTKQRLMGMYLSIYVHKDCKHLIAGVDKDFVTAGLAGGRLGNKGGIGISLKFADHRFLFVNSHLAAHTGRNAARMANIAKIKSELSLDCFLPKDDPRSKAKDLTDKFDSVFWCGDLNFRLDVARLHAEWLVEQKKYAEALTWDQLRNAMKDPATNPFNGFEEGIIDFPPTFKYDVWRSVKTTNKNLRRSLRRKNSISKAPNPGVVSAPTTVKTLDHVPEAEGEYLPDETDDLYSHASDDGARSPGMSRRSLESRRSFDPPSRNGATDRDEAEIDHHRDQAMINGMANSHRPLETKLKEKTKNLMRLMKIKTHLSPAPSKSSFVNLSRGGSLSKKSSMEFDQGSRRTSISSFASMRDRERETSPETPFENRPFGFSKASPTPSTSAFAPGSAGTGGLLSPVVMESGHQAFDRETAMSVAMPRRPSIASSFGSPQRPGRAFSLKRTLSGRSMKMEGRNEEDVVIDMKEDRREGVYDSSKKQRVPSWCDRVLWKAHPIPNPEDITSDNLHRVTSHDPDRSRFGRLSLAFSSLGMHLKSPLTRTITTDSSHTTLTRRSGSPHLLTTTQSQVLLDSASPSLTLVESPGHSHTPLRPETPTDQVPEPKALMTDKLASSRARSMTADSTFSTSSPPRSPARHPLLQTGGSQSGSPARPRITIDPASSPSHDRVPRPRANSESGPSELNAREQLFAASPGQVPPAPIRRLTGEPAPRPTSTLVHHDSMPMKRETSGPMSTHGPLGFKHRSRTFNSIGVDPTEKDDHRNAFQRFLHDLPNWLHRNQSTHDVDADRAVIDDNDDEQEQEAGEQMKRHMKGEVVCLHYGTIDDAGMRLLEGRSDHRPAIFAAAIYV